MPEPKEIRNIPVNDELHRCPDCGYELGFHTSFERVQAAKDSPVRSTREAFRVILICPECGARYDIGWRVTFSEYQDRFVKVPAGTGACVPHGSPAACLPPRLSPEHPPQE